MSPPDQKRETKDPFLTFCFKIELKGIIEAGFAECSGLQVETELEEYREGGVNDFIYKLPKLSKYQTITLKRGVTESDELWKWHQEVVNGKINRQNCSILLLDNEGKTKWRWDFIDVFPIKWVGPDLKADQGTIAIETLELAHHGFKKN